MLAYDYPLLGAFWTIFIFFLWFAWLVLLFRVFVDLFRNKEMGGFSKAIWALFVIVAPFLGVFIYIIVHGRDMTQRDIDQAVANQAAFDDYVRTTAGSGGSTADEIAKLAELHSQGVLTDDEFAAKKAQLLA